MAIHLAVNSDPSTIVYVSLRCISWNEYPLVHPTISLITTAKDTPPPASHRHRLGEHSMLTIVMCRQAKRSLFPRPQRNIPYAPFAS